MREGLTTKEGMRPRAERGEAAPCLGPSGPSPPSGPSGQGTASETGIAQFVHYLLTSCSVNILGWEVHTSS